MEVHVEIGAEGVQRRLDLVEHQLHALGAEGAERLVVRQPGRLRMILDDSLRDLGDIGAAVAILGHRLVPRGRQQGRGEPIDLHAGIVEVVLVGDSSTLRTHHPAQCVADGGPSRVPEVQRPGRIGRYEFEVDRDSTESVCAAILLAGDDDVAR